MWIVTAKNPQCSGIKGRLIPFALYGIHLVPAALNDKIDLAPALVPPVADDIIREIRLKLLQNHQVPEIARKLGMSIDDRLRVAARWAATAA